MSEEEIKKNTAKFSSSRKIKSIERPLNLVSLKKLWKQSQQEQLQNIEDVGNLQANKTYGIRGQTLYSQTSLSNEPLPAVRKSNHPSFTDDKKNTNQLKIQQLERCDRNDKQVTIGSDDMKSLNRCGNDQVCSQKYSNKNLNIHTNQTGSKLSAKKMLSQEQSFVIKADKTTIFQSRRIENAKFVETISTDYSRKIFSKVRISDFDIIRKLGSGKFGEVYLSKHRVTGLVVALKLIKKIDLDSKLKEQLLSEIKIQLFLEHPNIIKLYTFFDDSEHIYLVMQIAVSGHLYELVSGKFNQCLQESTVSVIVKQICQGVSYLHSLGIIHRDLKLQNILYQMGMIKICDFGWSIAGTMLRETVCGTPLYFSPELLKQKSYDFKIDIWSIGILTFQLLYGRVPFEIKEDRDFSKIVFHEVIFPKDKIVSKSAKQFISVCLQKDPDMRPSASQLLLQFDFLGNQLNYEQQIY